MQYSTYLVAISSIRRRTGDEKNARRRQHRGRRRASPRFTHPPLHTRRLGIALSPVRRQIDAHFHLSSTSSPHELLHPERLLLLGPPVLHGVLRSLLEIRRVDDDLRVVWRGEIQVSVGVVTPRVCVSRLKTHLVLVLAVFALGEHHGLVLLTDLDAELFGRRRRGFVVLGEPVLERHLAQLTSLELCLVGMGRR